MNMNKNDTFDRTLQEDRQTSLRSFSWGNRELRISSEKISLYVNGISYDTAPMLDIIHKAGVPPKKDISCQMDIPDPGTTYRITGM